MSESASPGKVLLEKKHNNYFVQETFSEVCVYYSCLEWSSKEKNYVFATETITGAEMGCWNAIACIFFLNWYTNIITFFIQNKHRLDSFLFCRVFVF